LPGWPLAKRVVEVIADRGEATHPRYRYGSGCVVAGRTVLTAAHVVEGAVSVTVRDPDKIPRKAALDPAFIGDATGHGPDLALVEVTDTSINVPTMGFAAVDRDSPTGDPVKGCHVVGYPAFAEQDGGRFRETADAFGDVPVLSRLGRGMLSVQVIQRPRPLPRQKITLGQSEWSGMSGAPVVADGRLLGVVCEHAPREGSSSIAATPLTALEADPAHPRWGPGVANPAAWWARLGIPGAHALRRLPPRRAEPTYLATVREIHRRTPQLLGREQELAEVAEFATGGEGYRWLTGGPWTGKTALVAEAVTAALPPSVFGVPYFVSRREGNADSNRFLAAVVPQLAYLLDEDAPDPGLDQFRTLWELATDRAAATGRHLLLVVDGLDEDLHPRELPSVASLLPANAGTDAHVLVTSRTHFSPDVSVGHPLLSASPVPLKPFRGAEHLADLARQEIDALLHGEDQDLAADVLGVLTAASGALALDDLATLTADPEPATPRWARQVDRIVTEKAARSLQPVGDRYQFAHGSLLEQAQTAKTLHALRHPDYRHRIFRWEERWRAAGWPTLGGQEGTTPRYLLDEYPATLTDEPKRLAALLNDEGWLAAADQMVGIDRLLADLRTVLATGQFVTIRTEEIRGWVYRRILDHMTDPDARRLAYLGPVLRRLTPDLIRYLLAAPSGVDVADDARAQQLLDVWLDEDQLLSRMGDGSLAYRPDMRRAILPLLQREIPGKVRALHSGAVAYYQVRPDLMSRAEELYHRLCLRDSPESLDQHWEPGVEPYLAPALEELPTESKAYLARRLGIDVSDVLDAASLREYEQHSSTRVR
jgi:Trypsin-like peptidase domain